jgi:hypothetical protein
MESTGTLSFKRSSSPLIGGVNSELTLLLIQWRGIDEKKGVQVETFERSGHDVRQGLLRSRDLSENNFFQSQRLFT